MSARCLQCISAGLSLGSVGRDGNREARSFTRSSLPLDDLLTFISMRVL